MKNSLTWIWMQNNKVFLNLSPDKLEALTAYGEARGEGDNGMEAVISVIRNRVKAGGWFIDKDIAKLSSNVHGVILKKWQFSCYNTGDPNRSILVYIAADWDMYLNLKEPLQDAFRIAQQSVLEDITNGATHYYEKHLPNPPKWAETMKFTAEIKNHLFYAREVV